MRDVKERYEILSPAHGTLGYQPCGNLIMSGPVARVSTHNLMGRGGTSPTKNIIVRSARMNRTYSRLRATPYRSLLYTVTVFMGLKAASVSKEVKDYVWIAQSTTYQMLWNLDACLTCVALV